jgi:hypothetical protein
VRRFPTMFDFSRCKPNTRKSLGTFILIATLLFSFATAGASPDKEKHSSVRQGGTIRMEPSGASFQIPPDWVSVRVERANLREVRSGKGEWKTEYTVVANAALPFSDCSVQAGKWDWEASTFAGVTVRGYVTNRSAADIEKKIETKALSAAKALPSPTIRNAYLTKDEPGQWHRSLITYDVSYGDYGGRANVDFYTTEKNGNTIVLVFMYVDMDNNLATVQQILRTFSW